MTSRDGFGPFPFTDKTFPPIRITARIPKAAVLGARSALGAPNKTAVRASGRSSAPETEEGPMEVGPPLVVARLRAPVAVRPPQRPLDHSRLVGRDLFRHVPPYSIRRFVGRPRTLGPTDPANAVTVTAAAATSMHTGCVSMRHLRIVPHPRRIPHT